LPATYGDPAREQTAMREGAILVARSARGRMTFEGAKAAEVLTGLVTNDVHALSPGLGQYAAALTPKGKILADVRIFARETDLLVDVPPLAWVGWYDMIRKYVNPRLARYAAITDSTAQWAVYGPRAGAVIAASVGIDPATLDGLAPYAHVSVPRGEVAVMIVRVPETPFAGFELIGPAALQPSLPDALLAAGAVRAGAEAVDALRIEAGRPEWGIDMDETTLPQEANFDDLHAISYTKGCYTGQETVARVHFRGHVNRMLRGLRFDESRPVMRGASLVDASGNTVGDVRSVGRSSCHGGIALAMVRREVEPETTLHANEVPVSVVRLPFGS
jgi:folate-binding protein YgfZ